jgi:hypothetical protein
VTGSGVTRRQLWNTVGVHRVQRGFLVRLGIVAGLAFLVRAVYVAALAPPATGPNDTFWYGFVSAAIANGHGFAIPHAAPGSALGFALGPTAQHPPLYPLALAGLRELGIASPRSLLWLGPVTGTVTVAGIGLLGRSLVSERVGLIGAAVASVYPLLVVADGALLSETMYGPVIVAILGVALALAHRPSARSAALLGALIGVAALVRSEAIGFIVLLALPLAWPGPGGWARLGRLAASVACMLVVITPWVVRNLDAFGSPILSTNDGVTTLWSNCPLTYSGPHLGYFDAGCKSTSPLTGNEAHQAAQMRRQGVRYAEDHAGRVPIVVLARVARTWGLFHPFQGSTAAGRNVTISNIGVVLYYPLALLAVVGGWALRRRRLKLWIIVAPLVLATLTAVTTFGSLRLRYVAEPSLVLLAAAGADALWRRRGAVRPTAPAVRTAVPS